MYEQSFSRQKEKPIVCLHSAFQQSHKQLMAFPASHKQVSADLNSAPPDTHPWKFSVTIHVRGLLVQSDEFCCMQGHHVDKSARIRTSGQWPVDVIKGGKEMIAHFLGG